MPLAMAIIGKTYCIQRITGKEDVTRFLANLGFVVGAEVSVVAEMDGNIIVMIKNSRVAIGKEMARRIIVAV